MKQILFIDTSGLAMCRVYSGRFRDYLSEKKIKGIIPRFAGLEAVSLPYNASHQESCRAFNSADVLVSLLNKTKTTDSKIRKIKPRVPLLNFRELQKLYGSEEKVFDFLVKDFGDLGYVVHKTSQATGIYEFLDKL